MSHPVTTRTYEEDEEEAYSYEHLREASLKIAAYADKRCIIPPRNGFGDYGPDIGVDGSFGYRDRTYNDQIRANMERSEAARSKRRG